MSDQDFKPSRAKSSNYEEIMQTYQTASKSCKVRVTGKENRNNKEEFEIEHRVNGGIFLRMTSSITLTNSWLMQMRAILFIRWIKIMGI
jgi:hypothetical protein